VCFFVDTEDGGILIVGYIGGVPVERCSLPLSNDSFDEMVPGHDDQPW
jgi:hypothetical protein